MKRLLSFAAVAILLLFAGCGEKEDGPKTVTKPKDLADPELNVTGVPTSPVESGSSFTITVSTKSKGAVTVSVDKPSVAVVKPKGDMQYEISAVAVQDTEVRIIIAQEEEKTDGYASATKEVSFTVKGAGDESLPGPDDAIGGTAVTFTAIEGEVPNPERGLYQAYEIHGNTPAISASDVKSKLASGHTIWLTEFYLTDFMNGNISSSYLKKVQSVFDAIRGGGAKAIVRFAYRDNNNNLDQDQEPEVAQVLKHVEQLKPILQKNEDVLFVLQAGFIGSWGEWYYTTHFNSMQDRKTLTEALLDAVPVSRQIQLRTPAFKMKMYNLSVKDTITAATAHDGSAVSRLAGHNDCFGADANDEGTFETNDSRKFWKGDTKYTIMGGETCKLSEYCLCPATLKDLEDYHWTYLHDGYNREVLSRWQNDGCFGEIKTRLGYKFVLKDVHYSALEAGTRCKITIRLYNDGYAAAMNPREAWLVWVGSDGKTEKSMLGVDPRTWQPGYNAVVSYFTPSSAKGTLYLQLSDPLLADNPAYSIALANEGVFDAKTGYNKLFEVK